MPVPGEKEDPDQKYSRCSEEKVRWRRQQVLGLTQEQLGKKEDIARMSVFLIEAGQMSPTAQVQN